MNKSFLLALLITFLISGCASFGPTVLIETSEPAEDFVVLCEWYVDPIFEFHGGGKLSKQNIYIAKSNEEVNCGVAMGGDALVKVMHPIYSHANINKKNGVTVYNYTKTKLDILDEQKDKFESGYWDDFKWPGSEYFRSVGGTCLGSFDYYYRYYLSAVEHIDFHKFMDTYYLPVLECLTKENMLRSDKRIREGIRLNYIDPEVGLIKWWDKQEKIASKYKTKRTEN